MAQIYANIVISGLRGKLGRHSIVQRGRHGQTTVVSRPHFPADRQFSDAQKQHQLDFREAAQYGKLSQHLPVYVKRAKGTRMTPYNAAVADWFNPPEIRQLDLGAWSGQPGRVIRILAIDDVQVKQVLVTITDLAGTPLEEGLALPTGTPWWEYTTTVNVTAGGPLNVTVAAQDLPGHTTQLVKAINRT